MGFHSPLIRDPIFLGGGWHRGGTLKIPMILPWARESRFLQQIEFPCAAFRHILRCETPGGSVGVAM